MTTTEKDNARTLIALLSECDDWQFADGVLCAINDNDETLLDNI